MSAMATVTLELRGKLQFFVIRGSQLFSTWKTTEDSSASWEHLRPFEPNPGRIDNVSAGLLSDGRAQLFATRGDQIFTIWKENTNENSAWVSGRGAAWDSFSP